MALKSKNDVEDGRIRLQRGDEKNETPKYVKKNGSGSPYERYMKLLFCFMGLQISYVAWGLLQENLMTQNYKLGKFRSSAFLVFANRFLALFLSLSIVVFKRFTTDVPMSDVPFYYYAPSSFSNTLSSWAQYEALKYVSFPTQVLSKSCKIIPVMLVGMVLNKKSYPWSDYVEAVLITAGVTMFTLSEKSPRDGAIEHSDSTFGILLLALYLGCDSFTSQWQSRVFKQHKVDQFQMMLGVNIWSMVMTGFTLYQSGDFLHSIAFIVSDPTALVHMTLLSLASATGQLFIFYTIKEFGPVIFTIMMTTRQLISLFASCLLFGHQLQWIGWISSAAVFCIVFYRIYRQGKA